MTQTLWIDVSLASQGLSGAEALQVREALEEQIEAAEIGEIVGGGCSTDGTSCDFELVSDDIEAAECFLRDLLSHADLLESTTILRR